jgi:serine-type D-Ala-D-Ala carboxypeptidase (penicillin-binding protein 5/6)
MASVVALVFLPGVASAQQPPPELNALSAIVVDADSGRVLMSKNADLRLNPASTTKIMTALLLAEQCQPEDSIVAPADVKKVKESSMHLFPGEVVSAQEMMYALLLRSANDGCYAVACHISGTEKGFAALMNSRAKTLGCTNTTFSNPHGLTADDHLTTARDLALIAMEAMKDPLFAQVVATQKHVIERSLNLKDTLMENHDKWLELDPRARGVKTGWTKPAGHCFVGCASDGGMTFITVLLKSDAWIHDQQKMVDWAFESYEPMTLCRKGDPAGAFNVRDGREAQVAVDFGGDAKALVAKREVKPALGWEPTAFVQAPVKAGSVVGYATYEEGTLSLRVPLVAAKTVEERTLMSSLMSPGGLVGFLALAGGATLVRVRSRRMARELG